MAATRADDRRSSSGGSSPPLCAEVVSCTDHQSKWGAPWRPEGARGAAGGSHGRLRGCQYSSLLVVASLAGGDDVDATTVSYLLSVALAKKKEEEKKEKEKEEKEKEKEREREKEKDKEKEKEKAGGAEGEARGEDAGDQPSRPRRYRHAC